MKSRLWISGLWAVAAFAGEHSNVAVGKLPAIAIERGETGASLQSIAAGFVIPHGSWFANGTAPNVPEPQIRRIPVMVFDQARVTGRVLGEAQQRAGVILAKAGVDVQWIDCHRSPVPPACLTVAEPDRLFLTIVTEDDARIFGNDVLGRSIPGSGDSQGVYARVFYRHIQAKAKQESIFPAELLGLAVAHELGHLLLGPRSHSAQGIMRANWNHRDMELGTKGQLLFTDRQSQLIRVNVQSRLGEIQGPKN